MFSTAYQHFIKSYSGFSRDVWLLTLVNFINRIGGMVVVFLTIYLKDELGFSLSHAGYILAAFGGGSVLGSYIGGQLTDKFSYFYIQLISLLAQGAFLICFPLFDSFIELVVATFFLSTISDIFRPANTVAYIRYSEPENRTRAFSLARLAFNLGFTMAPAFGGFLVPLGWHYLFWVDGITCWFAAGILFLYLKPKAKEQEAETIMNEKENVDASADAIPAYKNLHFLKIVILNFFAALIFMQLIWTVPVFWKDVHGFTEHEIGLLMSLNGLLIVLIEMPLIFSIENKRTKLYFVRVGILFYALTYLLFLPLNIGWVLAALAIIAISFGEIFVMPFTTSFVTEMVGPKRQGQYMALLGISYSVAHILSPLVGTQMADRWGFSSLWGSLVVLSFFLYIAYSFYEKEVDGLVEEKLKVSTD